MDSARFDQLTRRLSVTRTRRSLVGAALALLGSGVAAHKASAEPPSIHRTVCRPVGVGCTRHAQCCSATCVTGRALPRNVRNRCACRPDCTDRTCGDDGCGGSCGTCSDISACEAGVCICNDGACESNEDCAEGLFCSQGCCRAIPCYGFNYYSSPIVDGKDACAGRLDGTEV
jgi:hypothetical protein